jgi:hypothetical protein
MKSMLVLTMTVASISTDMASLFERATRLQSVTSRSQKSLGPLSPPPRVESATVTSISVVAPLPLARVSPASIHIESEETFAPFARAIRPQHLREDARQTGGQTIAVSGAASSSHRLHPAR